jgi:hypothetical protein
MLRYGLIGFTALSLLANPVSAQSKSEINAESSSSGIGPALPQMSQASATNADPLPLLHLLPGRLSSTASSQSSVTTPGATTGITAGIRSSGRPQSPQSVYDTAVADCMQMWDARTHMSRQEWLSTCKRVQTRLDNLKIKLLMPKQKTQVR